jgi:hypothetical protein
VPLVPNPILVEDLASLRPDGAPGAGPAPTVERAMREVLGASIKAHDGAAFIAALERSFTIADPAAMNGRAPTGTVLPATGDGRVWTWSPRGFALQADLGALAGAQASLYRRAQQALEESLPLLTGLEPLIPYDDKEAVAAAREVVRSELERVVEELAREGGPSVGLVDQLLTSLVGQAPALNAQRIPADAVGGHLGDLRERFGLDRQLVNTIDEEQNFTNFLVLADYITGLWADWGNERGAFTGAGGPPFFGTQLVLISRELQVASESVREVYAALDAVLIGESERATLRRRVGTADVYLGSLLEWTDRFLTVDARHLIETAGRDGALSLEATLQTLSAQVAAFAAVANPAAPPAAGIPQLFRNVVVHSTLTALQGSLDNLRQFVQALQPAQPVIGFPLRPPAVQQQPFVSGFTIATSKGTRDRVVTVTGADLDLVDVVFVLGNTRRAQRLAPVAPAPAPGAPRTWQATFPLRILQRGIWQVLLSRAGADWIVLDQHFVP